MAINLCYTLINKCIIFNLFNEIAGYKIKGRFIANFKTCQQQQDKRRRDDGEK